MLSLILSRLFKFAFFLFLIHAAASITSQITKKPFTIPTGKSSYITLAFPGIVVPAYKSTQSDRERKAPDTSVVTEIYSPEGTKVGSGKFGIDAHNYLDDTSAYRQKLKKEYGRGTRMTKDTQETIIWHQTWEFAEDQSYSSADFDSLNDGRVVVSKIITKNNGDLIKSADTLPDMRTARIFQATNQRFNKYNIAEEHSVHYLRVMPLNSWQLSWFLLYDVLEMTSMALLLLTISRLFKNFYQRNYFTTTNGKLLRLSGIYMLLPQVLLVIVYWAFLFGIHPIKIFVSTAGEFDTLAQYNINSDVDANMIFLGLALLVLSYIFRDGTRLKEEQALTI